MGITYTAHLQFRLKIRDIPYNLPRKLYQQSKEHYYDNLTHHYIAISQIDFKGKLREMAVTYDKKKSSVEIITIHPIKPYQKYSRIISRRWKKI